MKLPKLQLYTKIFIGLLLGIVFGITANQFGFSDFVSSYVKPVGTVFIRLISMIVVPLVFASLLVGTASLNDVRKLGRIGGKTIAFYMCTTAIEPCLYTPLLKSPSNLFFTNTFWIIFKKTLL